MRTPSKDRAGKKAHAQWEQQVGRRKTRIARIAQRLDRVGEIEEVAGVYAENENRRAGETETSVRSSGARPRVGIAATPSKKRNKLPQICGSTTDPC